MIKSLFSVGISRMAMILIQLGFIATFSRHLPVEELGKYSLIASIITPILWFLIFDAPVKIVSETMDTNNLFIAATPPLFVLLVISVPLLIVSESYESISINDYYCFTLIYLIKYFDIVTELDFAVLRSNNRFALFSRIIFIRSVAIYGIGIFAILAGFGLTTVLLFMLGASLIFLLLSILRLINCGWFFKVNVSEVREYILENKGLGVASGLKFFGSNIMRYFVAAKFGVTGLGYLTPVFYSLTAMTNIAIVFENVFSKQIIQTISEDDLVLHVKRILKIITIIIIAYIIFAFTAYNFSEFYYSLFFLKDEAGYHHLISIFATGWIFYLFRSLLKTISYRFKMQYMQINIQLLFILLLIVSMPIFINLFSVAGIAISYVFSSIVLCIFYLYRMNKKISIS